MLEIKKQIHTISAEMLELEDYELNDDELFSEYGMDSFLAMQLTAMLENEYDIIVPDEKLAEMKTVNKTAEIVAELVGT